MLSQKTILIVILILSVIIGLQFFKLYCKRRKDIIKLLIKRDTLPVPATGTSWMDGGVCYMKDGKIGRVDGADCLSMEVL